MTEQNGEGIIITRVFNAPRELVWKAWTDPEMVKKWWGPQGFFAPSITIDLRVGGKYIFAMHGPKGSEWDKDMYSAGIYKEIVLHEKLVVTDYFSDEKGNLLEPSTYGQDPNFPKEMTVTVLFEEVEAGPPSRGGSGEASPPSTGSSGRASKTKLSIIYPRPASEEQFQAMLKSGMNEGWNSSLDKLAETLK